MIDYLVLTTMFINIQLLFVLQIMLKYMMVELPFAEMVFAEDALAQLANITIFRYLFHLQNKILRNVSDSWTIASKKTHPLW